MERIVFIERGVDPQDEGLGFMCEVAKRRKAKVFWLLAVDASDMDRAQEHAERALKKYKEKVAQAEADLDCRVIRYEAKEFISTLEELSPMDLIVACRLDLSPLAEEGIKELEDISLRHKCPTIPLTALLPEKKASKGRILTRAVVFGALSACSYFFFFPQLDKLNHAIFMKGTFLGAIAVMVTAPIHAYIYGSFTEVIPKLLGLEKSAGIEH